VPVSFCEDDCPSPLFIPKHSAGAFHALQCRFGSVGKVLDGSRDLGCRHCQAGKRQFTQDQLRYRPSTAPLPRFLGAGCPLTVAEAISRRLFVHFRYGITGRSFAAKDVQRRAKSCNHQAMVDAKAQFRSLAEPWADTGTSTGRLMIAVLGGLRTWSAISSALAPPGDRSRAQKRGQRMGRPPKLTPAQQAEARRRRAQGATLAELARSYGVGKSTISRLRS
jgi:hypothetical protein